MASKFFNHGTLEWNVSLLGIAALITVAIGGIVEIARGQMHNFVLKLDRTPPTRRPQPSEASASAG